MGRPSKSLGRDTRQEILDASLDLFALHGYSGTSMRQIALAVGVRESALYHYFAAKEAIFEALTQTYGPSRAEMLTQVDFDAGLKRGLGPFLRKLAHTMMETWAIPREQKFMRMIMAEGHRMQPMGFSPQAVIGRAHQLIGAFFEELMRRKVIRTLPPEVVAREFIGPMVIIRLSHLMVAGDAVDWKQLRRMVDAHVEFFVEAVKK